jgi:ABC-2 type transport system permease protein
MNKTLFKASFKANRVLLLVTFLIILMYQTIIINMFDPEDASAMAEMIKLMPEGIMAAFGFDSVSTDLTTHIANFLYGFIFLGFPLIYVIPAGFKLMGKHIDSGSMAYLLATPHPRTRIAGTQAAFLLLSTTVLLLASVLAGMLYCALAFPGMLNIGKYLLLNLVTLSVFYVISGIVFAASSLLDESAKILGTAIGIPVAFFIFKMLYSADDKLSAFRYLTLYSLIDTQKILNGTNYAWVSSLVLFALAGLIYALAIYRFDKRSLILWRDEGASDGVVIHQFHGSQRSYDDPQME